MPTKIIIIGEMTDIKLMSKVNAIMNEGYQVAFKVMNPTPQPVTPEPMRVKDVVQPRQFASNPKRQPTFGEGRTKYRKFTDFHTAEHHITRYLQEKGQATVNELASMLSNVNGPGKGYALNTGSTTVSKMVREGKLIRDEIGNVVLA